MIRDKAKSKEFWEQVRVEPAYQPFIDELSDLYEKDCQGALSDISYDTFMEYFRSGSRIRFNEMYDKRRRRLNADT